MNRFTIITVYFIAAMLNFTLLAQELKTGDVAPDFTLRANDGKTYHLNKLVKKSVVVLYFYPKAMTPGCTKQACSIRDGINEFQQRGITILGISVDSMGALKQFTEKEKLNFPLLPDADGSIAKAYQVYNAEKSFSKRASFVIGKGRKILGIIPKVDVNTHLQDVLKIVDAQKM